MAEPRGVAAVVPATIGGAVLAGLWRAELTFQAGCRPETIGACLSWRIPVLLLGPVVVAVGSWLVLRAAGAARPLLATSLGVLATAGVTLLHQAGRSGWNPPSVPLAALFAAFGFTVGVVVAGLRMPVALRAALAVLLAVPVALFPTIKESGTRDGRVEKFARLGLPLLVPEVGAYRVVAARADPAGGQLSLVLADGPRRLSVDTIRVPADFAPPQRCGPSAVEVSLRGSVSLPPSNGPCQRFAADHWLRTENGHPVHLLRRGDALVLVSPGVDVPDRDVAAAAGQLVEVSPRELAALLG
ncbi:hypothetical protein FXF53_13160 [Micromonospora sp. WP24]|uniref:hypothetical protein n=1 Tax=Micromonospora sp. WP24 TaxID=2604469 RepID=UPI0011D9C462|nr:hypothetical protein [Micromonospora sp. WP24]TYC00602.1 hypothetical protein FXF53_13160 [Micromonospora sp. WP24]